MTSPVNPQLKTVKNINLFTGSGKTRKINPQRIDQLYQIKIDGVVFSGQAQINGKPILVKRKGQTLILSTPEDIDPLLEVSDFFMSASSTDELRELSTSELQSVIQAGSSSLDVQSHEGVAHASSADVVDAAVQPKREGEGGWQLFVRGSDSAGLEKMNDNATDSSQIPGSWGWLAGAVAAAGGGGGGGGTTTQAALAINKVIGSITAGPLFNAADVRVEVYDKAGKFLGLAEVRADGNFSYSWTSATAYTGELLFKAYSTLQDTDDYRDEMGTTKDLPTLRAATYMTDGTASLYITPLTEYAVLKMGLAPDGLIPPAKDSLDAINMQVAKQFAIDPTNPNADVTKNEPVAAINADGTDNAQVNAYGKVLAVLSAVESAKGLSTAEVLTQINQREDSNNLDTLTQLTKKYLAAVDDSVSTKYKGFIVDLGLNLSFGTPTQHVVEAGGVHNATPGQPSATITFTMFDAAAGDVVSYDANWLLGHGWSTSDSGLTYSKTGTYGTATLTLSTNIVSYQLNNLDPDTEVLMQGQSVQDQFLVQITDQTGATAEFWANFDIDGANDGVAYIDHVTSNITIANIGDDYLPSANNGAITFTVHFSKQLANAATALDALGANFELVLSDGTKLTAGTDFFAEVTLDATDATNQTYTLAVFLMTPVDDAAVTLHYLAQPAGAAAAVCDIENVVTADHTAFANEIVNTHAFKQSIDTSTPDAAVTLTDAGTDSILSGAAQGVGLVSAAEKTDTAATFTASHAPDATQVEFFTADGLNWLATANVLNSWGITLNLSTLNANLDANTGTGSYQFVTRQTDDAGNVARNTYNLNFDTLAQSISVVSGISATVADADYTGAVGSEVFTISGGAHEAGTVTVVWDQGANGSAEFTLTDTVTSAEVGSSNAWSVDFLKSDLLSKGGAGQFTVTFTDLVGNSLAANQTPHYLTQILLP
jgi:VCBS repeat-containing protein